MLKLMIDFFFVPKFSSRTTLCIGNENIEFPNLKLIETLNYVLVNAVKNKKD